MRSGACTVQQTLTAEAASVLKHSLSLARRRGHGQITPLHVAATLLSSRASLLRSACLKSQPQQQQQQYSQTTSQYSHPLQWRALELCFNVALNRLPTTPGPILHGQPSLSNALVAALKRAQAHQRRGCIEQQQPILTIKVELEQLIISILDDPSVSRVMREAGFSSTAVKNNIEDSLTCSPTRNTSLWQTPFSFSPQKKVLSSNYITDSSSLNEDIKLVFEVLSRKRRNSVIVGDCVSTTESLISELKGRIERGDVPEGMKHVHFLHFYFSPVSLRFMRKEDVERHISGLKRRVDSIACGGAIIYTGDLKWTVEENFNGEMSGYSAVDHLVSEIGRLSNTKVWLVATASYQTYSRCQMRQPPLEVQWALQAVSVPSGGLSLSLHASSANDSRMLFHENTSLVAGNGYPFASSYPWWPSQSSSFSYSNSISFADSGPRFRKQNSCTVELNFGNAKCQSSEPNLDSLKNSEDKEVKVTLGLGSSTCTGLCDLLHGNLPWQSEIIPSIAEALTKKETWLLIEGNDVIGKRRLARAVSEHVLGSADLLLHMDMRNDNEVTSCNERLLRAFDSNEKLVALVENVDFADTRFLKMLADRLETEGGSCTSRAVFILTMSIGSSYEEYVKMNHDSVIQMKLSINGKCFNKRKPEWGVSNKIKTARINEEIARQSSFKMLDLNMRADEGNESEDFWGFLELIKNRYVFNTRR